MTEFAETKTYEVQQLGESGTLLASQSIEATSGETAATQLQDVVDGVRRIVVCLDGAPMNEMGIDYWQKRMRRR